jgi:hypothetical protein
MGWCNVNLIPIAEFCSHGIPGNTTTISVEKVDNQYYFITNDGHRGMQYQSLDQARADIADAWGKFKGFRLIKEED